MASRKKDYYDAARYQQFAGGTLAALNADRLAPLVLCFAVSILLHGREDAKFLAYCESVAGT